MQVLVNDQEIELVGNQFNLAALVAQLPYPDDGVAVAVGTAIVPRHLWQTTPLSAGDRISVFRAIAGG